MGINFNDIVFKIQTVFLNGLHTQSIIQSDINTLKFLGPILEQNGLFTGISPLLFGSQRVTWL